MILRHALRRHLQLVVHPENITSRALRVRLALSKEFDEGGISDDFSEAGGGVLDV